MIYINNIALSFIYYITKIEKTIPWAIFKKCKIMILKYMIYQKDYIDNKITNIVCTKLNKSNNCERALHKVMEKEFNIFRISPRGLVFCVLHKNYQMLTKLKQLGYPLEMIIYASNYHLIKKRRLEKYIYNFAI
jgi:hypothetical protein